MHAARPTDADTSGPCADILLPGELADREMPRRIGAVIRRIFADSPARKMLFLLASGSISLFAIGAVSGLFRGIESWERTRNLSDYHAGEFAILSMVLGIACAIFLFLRFRETREETRSATKSGTDAPPVDPRLPLRYEELENLFQRVETAKKEWEMSLDSIRDMVVLTELDGTIHRCNRAFRDFLGLPYGEILREDFASLLARFGIDMQGLDLSALNARFHISGKWFGVRSYPYKDFETANITRVVILMLDVSAGNVSAEKVRFVWARAGHPRPEEERAEP